ncbi:G-type lectin S-receptor-like serine/threonine-protein kinase At4g27290 [Camellia sinensis]|uniref:G-type lectin S-receptor-like serine/threonine-protein kinase At4g27290 n=1 Tax=Camellia sinensis TaxID=4442 RepID=UPI0010361BF2|nr:G-type lectin S-receptor-like serine/threonine-protein kinase At4g27290 [Camellia sinensis]
MANTNYPRMRTFAHLVFLLISSCLLFVDASTDTIVHGQSITASNTIVSAGNVFELGFFNPGNGSSTMNYYLGIWYKNISEQTVVWVANRDYPFTDSSVALLISADGNLVIVKGKISYTLTNISSNGKTSATLLDSGNPVLRDETSGDLLWESFDYPSHTLLPGMKLGRFDNWISWKPWSLISWKSREDPGPGVFSLESDPLGMHQFFIRKGYQKYWTSGVWNGKSFPMIPDMTAHNINITFSFNPSGAISLTLLLMLLRLLYLCWMYQGNFSCCRGLKLIINGICFGFNQASSARFMPTVGLLAVAVKRPVHIANACLVLNHFL